MAAAGRIAAAHGLGKGLEDQMSEFVSSRTVRDHSGSHDTNTHTHRHNQVSALLVAAGRIAAAHGLGERSVE